MRVHEVARRVHAPVGPGQLGVCSQNLELPRRPDEEFALDAFLVGVLGAVEAAFGAQQLAFQIAQGGAGQTEEVLLGLGAFRRYLMRLQIRPGELGVVVEHLLEVGNQPAFVHAVAVKSAAELVVKAAQTHHAQGGERHAAPLWLGQ